MPSLLPFILILLVVLFLVQRWKHPRMKKNYPPGPPKLPLLGSLPFLGMDNINETYFKLAAKYGKTFSIQIGPEDIIISSDFSLIHKLFKDKRMIGRPSLGKLDVVRFGDYKKSIKQKGLIFSEGNEWSEQRKFSLHVLRDFGFGKSSMTEMIYEEVTKFKNDLRKDLGKPICLRLLFNISVVNALWRILTGKSFALDDPQLNKIVKQLDELMKMESLSIAFFLFPPWFVDLLPEGPFGIPDVKGVFDDMKSLISPYITEHKEKHDSNSLNDFMDVYIEKINNTTDPSSSFFGNNGEKNMVCSMIDLFFAGSETTSSTLLWTFFLMCHYPDVQTKLRKEMENVVGSRTVELEDRHNLPYVEAVICEIHRYVSLAAIGVVHRATEDIEVDGIFIPAGTQFFAHIFGVQHDPEYWKNPDEFNPERFLDQDGKYRTDQRMMAFSVGKRFCLGQSLAQNELFMFMTLFIQDFSFSFPPGYTPPPINKYGDVIMSPASLNQCPEYQLVMQAV